ncbi:DNA breaking-rejoining enzyme [Lentinula novae-zelandiae]|nr:DNA breaking-rejoining enzyme [Lentinula novae-zelandiae]
MESCDEINLDGSEKDKSKERSTFTHAQKMRAAATFGFGRIHVSETLTSYMLSLHRRKTLIGETATSARAVTLALLSNLFEFNNQPKFAKPRPYEPTARNAPKDPTDWGGRRACALLHLGYTLAFCDLLRIDELLQIQVHNIVIEKDPKTGVVTLTLTLPFRKTCQFGDIKPFILYEMPRQYAHLCPVRAFSKWLHFSWIRTGYLFRKFCQNDRIAEENKPMTSEQFLEMFRNNLIDIGTDYFPYGTHSFRCGGCQWLSVERPSPLRQICEWGSWSQEFTHLTIVKYLISGNDNPTVNRYNFFNMHRKPTTVCPTCNRSCHCN